MISQHYGRLWKLPFNVSVSKMCTYSHVELKLNRIEIRRDELFVVGFYGCKKSIFQMVFEFFRSILSQIPSDLQRRCTSPLWAIDICPKIEGLRPKYECTGLVLTKNDLKSVVKIKYLN